MVAFKRQYSLYERKTEATRMLGKYPDRIPIICENARNSSLPEIAKNKYLVPRDLALCSFMTVIRKQLSLRPEQAIFLFINNKMYPASSYISAIYEKEVDEDGFLYIVFAAENVFGAN